MQTILRIISALFIGCILFFSSGYMDAETAASNRVEKKIIKDVITKLKQERNLHFIALGGLVEGKIQAINLGFYLYEEISLAEARGLIVYVVDTLLSRIQEDPSVKPYFKTYPMTSKQVGVRIWVRKPDKTKVPVNQIDYIAESDEMITYQTAQEAPEYSRVVLKESLSDALLLSNRVKK